MDIGTGLVAANRDCDDFTAIWCKMYSPVQKVAKSDIDSFLAAFIRPDFRETRPTRNTEFGSALEAATAAAAQLATESNVAGVFGGDLSREMYLDPLG